MMIARILLAALCSTFAFAEVLELRPLADTSIHEVAPEANMGRHSHMAIGVTAKPTAARGLIRFDLGEVPANAVVASVTVIFALPELNRVDALAVPYSFHRMLVDWGEGTKTGSLGSTASTGEATWNHSVKPAVWAAPGGMPGTDFAAEASATATIGPAPGTFTVPSSPGLVADIQAWIASPDENYGWLIKAVDETVRQSAKQFTSRETGGTAPILRIEYSLPGSSLRFTSIEREGTNLLLAWEGSEGPVVLERTQSIPPAWVPVVTNSARAFSTRANSAHEFYRLRINP